MSPLTRNADGTQAWTHQPGDTYIVTGTDTAGKRFRLSYDRWLWASGINLYRGSKWLLRGGKRWLIQRVYN